MAENNLKMLKIKQCVVANKLPRNRPYVCNICFKHFETPSKLARHYLIHTGQKPFECDVCHKTFRQLVHLERHQLTHSLPFKCSICQRHFKIWRHLWSTNNFTMKPIRIMLNRSEDCWRPSKKSQCMECIILLPQRKDGPYTRALSPIPCIAWKEERIFMHVQSVARCFHHSQNLIGMYLFILVRGLLNVSYALNLFDSQLT